MRNWLDVVDDTIRAPIIGRKRHPGHHRRVPQDLFQVIGEEEEHAEQADTGQPDRQVGPAPEPVEDDPQWQQRMRPPAVPSARTGPAGPPRPPGGRWSAGRSSSWYRPPTARRRRRPGPPPPAPSPARRGARWGRGDHGSAAGSRPRPRPTEKMTLTYRHHRQDRYSVSTPPSSSPTATAGPGDRAEDAERLTPFGRVGERHRQRGQRGRRQQRAERALDRARDEQHREVLRGPAEGRGAGEADHAMISICLRPTRSDSRPPRSSSPPKASE